MRCRSQLTALLLIGAGGLLFSGCGSTDTTTGPDSGSGEGGGSGGLVKSGIVNVGSGDTVHVGPKAGVKVDTLTWHVKNAAAMKEIGDQYSGSKANGVYVVVKASVTNGKSDSVTINSDIASLESDGKSYSGDTDGQTAVELSGAKSFFLEDLGPDVSTTGSLVFDVPPALLKKSAEVCFGELGFGDSKGCIKLKVRK
jgi:hypothetical protein